MLPGLSSPLWKGRQNGLRGDEDSAFLWRRKREIFEMELIKNHRELKVYQKAFCSAMEIFLLTKTFPKEETYSLIDQIRRPSRSVNSNLAEAFRRRQYPRSFLFHSPTLQFSHFPIFFTKKGADLSSAFFVQYSSKLTLQPQQLSSWSYSFAGKNGSAKGHFLQLP